MAGNSYGTIFKLTTFGESHGPAIGGIIDGCPPGLRIDLDAIQKALNRRRPGQSAIVTQRKEPDEVVFLSGIFEGKTTGTPIGFHIVNANQKSNDYEHLKEAFRPSHADFTYEMKYGIRDYKGGGRSSARETAARVVAGEIARLILPNITISTYVSGVGSIRLESQSQFYTHEHIESNPVRCPEAETASRMEELIREVRKNGDTVGGVVTCFIDGIPAGLGEPVFDKLHAELGKAMLSINAVKGFEYGSGFSSSQMLGSQHNDLFHENGSTKTNFSGGIQGGISNGMPIYFNVAFKPVATLMQTQEMLTKEGELTELSGKGRHDPCVVPRAVPIVEAMALIVLADFHLRQRVSKS